MLLLNLAELFYLLSSRNIKLQLFDKLNANLSKEKKWKVSSREAKMEQ